MEEMFKAYLKFCNDDFLYQIFEIVIAEINKRKAEENGANTNKNI